jgi:geranylgeranyl diphosphate synthase, type I
VPADLNPLLALLPADETRPRHVADAHALMTLTSDTPPTDRSTAFRELALRVRADVEAALAATFDEAKTRAQAAGPRAHDVVAALAELATRGGKRLRAVLVAAGYEACDGEGGAATVTLAGVAIEVLQAYLLVHDDWMDQDDVRRGGPSVHASLRVVLADTRLGDVAAILAGDYGVGLAQSTLLRVPLPAERVLEAAKVFARIQEDVVTGQVLDVLEVGHASGSVEVKHDLKTGSYTVRGPLALGAALAGAPVAARKTLDGFAAPLGIAFQLRDDLLGTFGDAKATGKPIGSDLREGKRTALVEEAEKDRDASRLLARVLGVADAPDDEVAALVARLEACGARARVETRIAGLLTEARAVLAASTFSAHARAVLEGAASALASRES